MIFIRKKMSLDKIMSNKSTGLFLVDIEKTLRVEDLSVCPGYPGIGMTKSLYFSEKNGTLSFFYLTPEIFGKVN